MSASASNSEKLKANYLSNWKDIEFDFVFINLGNNDRVEGFETNLTALIEILNKTQSQIILMLEPNTKFNLAEKHAVIKKVARDFSLPVLDLNLFIQSPKIIDSGLIWWDFIHFTQYGHDLVGSWLFREFKKKFTTYSWCRPTAA